MQLIVHTDGGARGNPGPAAVGVVIEECQMPNAKCKIIVRFGKRIGETTNNVAEYTAVVEALKYLTKRQATLLRQGFAGQASNPTSPRLRGAGKREGESDRIDFFLDSTLVVNQLNGLFKVKDARLRELLATVRTLEPGAHGDIRYTVIPREQNTQADALVNEALDENRG